MHTMFENRSFATVGLLPNPGKYLGFGCAGVTKLLDRCSPSTGVEAWIGVGRCWCIVWNRNQFGVCRRGRGYIWEGLWYIRVESLTLPMYPIPLWWCIGIIIIVWQNQYIEFNRYEPPFNEGTWCMLHQTPPQAQHIQTSLSTIV